MELIMNVLEIIQDALITFLYGENAILEIYEQQVIYILSMGICITFVLAFFKFIFNLFRI